MRTWWNWYLNPYLPRLTLTNPRSKTGLLWNLELILHWMKVIFNLFCYFSLLHVRHFSFSAFNPFPSKRVLRALIDFTLSNARRFYSSMGNLLDRKGLFRTGCLSFLEKRTYNGLPDFMTKVAREELNKLSSSITECNVVYLPQVTKGLCCAEGQFSQPVWWA